MKKNQDSIFNSKYVAAEAGSNTLFNEELGADKQEVTCLGKKFSNDEARRKYFTDLLREKLKDPEFRNIEGFPIGEDEDILALSDPPYYTACPNPWIGEFIEEWENQKPFKPEDYVYHREPFAADVSEGKNDPIYNAHSYHTKVPHKAIMRYILHYTEPGDIVFDGFAGTGMTGVAAQMCANKEVVESLGYKVESNADILQKETNEEGKEKWVKFSKLGARKAVLNDLSTAATFISYNYNTPVDVKKFEREAQKILDEVEKECGWMYETMHKDGKTKGKINYTVWSDVFLCPECLKEIIFWNVAVNTEQGKVLDEFYCPYCSVELTKRNMDRVWITKFDEAINKTIKQVKQVPVLIKYSVGKQRFEKYPDDFDFTLIEKINNISYNNWYPNNEIKNGEKTQELLRIGLSHQHHLYTSRNLIALAIIFHKSKNNIQKFHFTGLLTRSSKQARFLAKNYFHGGGGWVGTNLSGTLFVPSLNIEVSPIFTYANRISKLRLSSYGLGVSSTQDSSNFKMIRNSIDYIFIDPPFGSNLQYSELNILLESWLRIFTNNGHEAVINKSQSKGLFEYKNLMTECFREVYRILKPGRWMTIEFSNTKSAVWNSIQSAITEAGFIVANVSALDKKQGSFNSVTNPTSVKQDLVISAYKPNGGFEERFINDAENEEGVWDFIRTHLKYLPVTKTHGKLIVTVPERDPRILFDQVVAYFVRKGFAVPISSHEFQIGLSQWFDERDGMCFLSEQAAEYDRKKMLSGTEIFQNSLFVSDEATAINWLRQLLKKKPQTYSDIHPQFIQELGGWNKNEISLELSTMLEQNFLNYDGKTLVPEQIHAYLSTNWKDMRNLSKDDPTLVAKAKGRWYVPDPTKSGDLDKLREKALLREFEEYKTSKKKLKVFRLEAIRAGFKKAWQEKDYKLIIKISEKMPSGTLEEDSKLLMWYDQAITRTGEE